MKSLARNCALACAFQLGVSLSAQVVGGTSSETTVATSAKTMADALRLRGDIASAVAGGDLKSEAALGQLRAANSPSGLNAESDADFSYAAIDVGQRLIVLRKPAQAEEFFRAAETALDSLVKRTSDAQAKEKAQYLRKLAFIRGNYLNKAKQAKADIEQAITLQPDDKGLQRAKQVLANTNAVIFSNNPKG